METSVKISLEQKRGTHLQLVETSFYESEPVAEEELARGDTETDDSERVGKVPVPRFSCHIPCSRVYCLHRFRPLRVVDLCLGRLTSCVEHTTNSHKRTLTLPMLYNI